MSRKRPCRKFKQMLHYDDVMVCALHCIHYVSSYFAVAVLSANNNCNDLFSCSALAVFISVWFIAIEI